MASPARIRATIASVTAVSSELRELRAFHKALADVNRLRLVHRLAEGPATVAALTEHVGLSQPLVSWHLGRLRSVGLVEMRRSGRETVCSLCPTVLLDAERRQRSFLGLPR